MAKQYAIAFDDSDVVHTEPDGSVWRITIEWAPVGEQLWQEPISIKIATEPEIPWRAMSASDVRRLPLGTIVADERARRAAMAETAAGDLVESGLWTAAQGDAVAAAYGPHRGRSTTADELRLVADAYIDARKRGAPVTAAVAAACGVSESTAGKRIMRARRAGLLPEVER